MPDVGPELIIREISDQTMVAWPLEKLLSRKTTIPEVPVKTERFAHLYHEFTVNNSAY